MNQSLTENFVYDALNRLDFTSGVSSLDLTYDAIGNIAYKSDVGSYTYHATKKHAVTAAGAASYVYDANGNMTSRAGTEILWFANNLPKRIRKTPGSTTNSSEFQYGPSGMRWRHAYRKGSTLYTHVYIGSLLEKVTQGSNVEWKHYIHANGAPVALVERHSNGTNTPYYLLKDHLGSTNVITNATGGVFVRESSDAFGKRRGANWTGVPTSTEINNMNTSTRRGFTSHEHLDSTDLIHMNGRVQDPLLGRFISADPFVQSLCEPQSLNRMSYAWNNPLSHTDSSGFILDSSVQTICVNGCGGDTLMGEMTVARDAWGEQALADLAFVDMQIGLSNISGPGASEMPEDVPEGVLEEVTTTASRPDRPDFWQPILPLLPFQVFRAATPVLPAVNLLDVEIDPQCFADCMQDQGGALGWAIDSLASALGVDNLGAQDAFSNATALSLAALGLQATANWAVTDVTIGAGGGRAVQEAARRGIPSRLVVPRGVAVGARMGSARAGLYATRGTAVTAAFLSGYLGASAEPPHIGRADRWQPGNRHISGRRLGNWKYDLLRG